MVAKPRQRVAKVPPAREWEEFGELRPGHFWTADVHEARWKLHFQGVVPQVILSGLGAVKGLKYNDTHIHLRHDAHMVCEVLAKLYPNCLLYTSPSPRDS